MHPPDDTPTGEELKGPIQGTPVRDDEPTEKAVPKAKKTPAQPPQLLRKRLSRKEKKKRQRIRRKAR